VNKICIVGRLTADPNVRQVGERNVAEFSVAVNRFKKDEADFFTVKAWGKTADFCANYLSKGRMVSVDGRMESRKYEKDGRMVTVWDIVADNVNGLDKPSEPGSKIRDNDPWIRAVPPPPLPGEIEDPFA
jgi:single-strand DNA-binding protein